MSEAYIKNVCHCFPDPDVVLSDNSRSKSSDKIEGHGLSPKSGCHQSAAADKCWGILDAVFGIWEHAFGIWGGVHCMGGCIYFLRYLVGRHFVDLINKYAF